MNDYAIVVLSGYPDIFAQFWFSYQRFEVGTPLVLVTSGQMSTAYPELFRLKNDPFSFPRAANHGIKACAPADVFLVNDDVQFLRAGSVGELARIAHAHPEVGVLSPQFEGRIGNRMQERKGAQVLIKTDDLYYSEQRLCFTGVYIRRTVIDVVGLLDERFDGYGAEDDQYCLRVQDAGFKLAVTPDVVMRHGFGADQHSASFKRAGRYPASGIDPRMKRKYEEWLKERPAK